MGWERVDFWLYSLAKEGILADGIRLELKNFAF
jgi:hypothetical protein